MSIPLKKQVTNQALCKWNGALSHVRVYLLYQSTSNWILANDFKADTLSLCDKGFSSSMFWENLSFLGSEASDCFSSSYSCLDTLIVGLHCSISAGKHSKNTCRQLKALGFLYGFEESADCSLLSIFLLWFKPTHIYSQISTHHNGGKQGIDKQIINSVNWFHIELHILNSNFVWNWFPIKNLLINSLLTPSCRVLIWSSVESELSMPMVKQPWLWNKKILHKFITLE